MSNVTEHEDRLDAFFDVLQGELLGLRKPNETVGYAVDRLRNRARKRAGYVRPELSEVALDNFIAINERLKSVRIPRDNQVIRDARHYITVVLERFTKRLYPEEIQNPLELSFLYDNWRFGPGSSNGVKGTHTAEKIVQPMTCTKLCEPLVRKLRSSNPYFSRFDAETGRGTEVVSGSRLTTVPKNQDAVRTIAVEPSGNMALQLAAGSYLEGALRSVGLDIRTQQRINQRFACTGSIDGSLATIDLSSASDMISIDLVRSVMPEPWFRLLCHLRSGDIEIPNRGSHQLNMISTMGNGFTFPLMTLIIVALIYGFRASRGGPNLFVDWTSTAVFGDDIIIPSDEYLGFCEVLSMAGLVVNHDKSYSAGPFRESCGGDYYKGVDVTPFYVQRLQSPPDIYVALNQVLSWCGKHNLCLHATILYLRNLLGAKVFLVPEWLSPYQGVQTIQVSRKYSYLSVVPYRKRLGDNAFAMPLICGGYIEAAGPDMVYMPRPKAVKYVVRSSRLPTGFLDGRDPLSRSRPSSEWVSMLIDILL